MQSQVNYHLADLTMIYCEANDELNIAFTQMDTLLCALEDLDTIITTVERHGATPAVMDLLDTSFGTTFSLEAAQAKKESLWDKVVAYLKRLWDAFVNFLRAFFGKHDPVVADLKKQIATLKQKKKKTAASSERLTHDPLGDSHAGASKKTISLLDLQGTADAEVDKFVKAHLATTEANPQTFSQVAKVISKMYTTPIAALVMRYPDLNQCTDDQLIHIAGYLVELFGSLQTLSGRVEKTMSSVIDKIKTRLAQHLDAKDRDLSSDRAYVHWYRFKLKCISTVAKTGISNHLRDVYSVIKQRNAKA